MSTDYVLSVMIGPVHGFWWGRWQGYLRKHPQKFNLIAIDYMIRCHACDINKSSASRIIRRQNLGLQVLRSGNSCSLFITPSGSHGFPATLLFWGREGRGVYRRGIFWCSRIHLGNRFVCVSRCANPNYPLSFTTSCLYQPYWFCLQALLSLL